MAPSIDGFSRERHPVTYGFSMDDRTTVGMLYIKDGQAMIGDTVIGDLKSKQTSNKIRTAMVKALLIK